MENIRIKLLLDEVYSVMMKESIEEKKTFVKLSKVAVPPPYMNLGNFKQD